MNTYSKLLAAVLLAGTAQAQAASISFEDSVPMATTDWTDTLTVSQFDSSLGTLTGVQVYFEGNVLSDMILDNDNATGVNVVGSVNAVISGGFQGLSLSINAVGGTGVQALGADDSGNTDAAGDGGVDEVTITDISGFDSMLLSVGPSASWIGGGTLSTTGLGTFAGFGISGGGGNVDASVSTQASALLRVTYIYDDGSVPAPAPIALLGLGLVALGLRRRKSI